MVLQLCGRVCRRLFLESLHHFLMRGFLFLYGFKNYLKLVSKETSFFVFILFLSVEDGVRALINGLYLFA
jgi:hypothetical protein